MEVDDADFLRRTGGDGYTGPREERTFQNVGVGTTTDVPEDGSGGQRTRTGTTVGVVVSEDNAAEVERGPVDDD